MTIYEPIAAATAAAWAIVICGRSAATIAAAWETVTFVRSVAGIAAASGIVTFVRSVAGIAAASGIVICGIIAGGTARAWVSESLVGGLWTKGKVASCRP